MSNEAEITCKMAAAKIVATRKKAPYLAIAINSMIPHKAPGLGTFGVTKDWIMMWDPAAVERWNVDQIATVLVHEVSHLLRRHAARAKRCGAYDNPILAQLWNQAADGEINDDLIDAGIWEFPTDPPPILPEQFECERGGFAEVYYAKLKKDLEEMLKEKGGEGEEGEGEEDDGESAAGGGSEDPDDDEKDDESGKGKSEDDEQDEDSSGGSGKQDEKGEDDEESDSGGGSDDGDDDEQSDSGGGGSDSGDDEDGDEESGSDSGDQSGSGSGSSDDDDEDTTHCPPAKGWHCGSGSGNPLPIEPGIEGRSEAECEQIRRDTAEAIRQIATRSRGSIPGGWSAWAEVELGPVRIPWEQKLARACRHAVEVKSGDLDSDYSRPHRWQAVLGTGPGKPILAHPFSPIPSVLGAIDTSGSMGSGELSEAASQIDGVIKALDAEMIFCSFDAKVQAIAPIRNIERLEELLKGRGGTDFRPLFKLIEDMPKKPDILIVCTDGMGPAPIEPPLGLIVIWVLVGPHKQTPTAGNTRTPVDYGEVIEVEPFEEEEAA